MIPPIRTGVLSVDEPAKSLVQEDEEAERKERERELNRKNKDPEVCGSGGAYGVMVRQGTYIST